MLEARHDHGLDDPMDIQVRTLRAILADQATATDSLERRALLLISPVAFVLALGINNVVRVASRPLQQTAYYAGLMILVAGMMAGATVLWPRRPLHDPTLMPPRGPDIDTADALTVMAASSLHNVKGYRLKTVALRLELVALVLGSLAIVVSAASATAHE